MLLLTRGAAIILGITSSGSSVSSPRVLIPTFLPITTPTLEEKVTHHHSEEGIGESRRTLTPEEDVYKMSSECGAWRWRHFPLFSDRSSPAWQSYLITFAQTRGRRGFCRFVSETRVNLTFQAKYVIILIVINMFPAPPLYLYFASNQLKLNICLTSKYFWLWWVFQQL